MQYQRVLTIQDISCVGQCSATVALPILSVCGLETCLLPSAVLSSHTGGFGKPYIHNLANEIPPIAEHWIAQKIDFDGIYTGYLGSIQQIKQVHNLFDCLIAPNGKRIVDPVMADHGKFYKGFSDQYGLAMKALCIRADVIIPNWTEACILAGTPYDPEPDQKKAEKTVEKLHCQGVKNIILTGISDQPGQIRILISDGNGFKYYSHLRVPRNYNGTGDIFASAFTGAWMQGKSLCDSVQIAADYTHACITETFRNPAHWYGVKFETVLPQLAEAMK